MTPDLSLKIDTALDFEEGTMLLLQAYFEIDKAKLKRNSAHHPDFSIIRKALFWDTDFDKIDWEKKYKSIIKRVFERGSDEKRKISFIFSVRIKLEPLPVNQLLKIINYLF